MTYTEDALAGRAFSGEAIVANDGSIGNVLLWNPYGTGKLLVLDQLSWATGKLHGTGYNGADLRNINSLIGFSSFEEGHVANKAGEAAPPAVGQLYVKAGAVPATYPYNRPHHEFWQTRAYDSRPEVFGAPYVIQQGRGKNFGMASAGQLIVTFHWREVVDPQGPISGPPPPPPPPGSLGGTPVGDMANMSLARDGNEATYAGSNGDTLSIVYGLDLGVGVTSSLSRAVFKSPPGRSLCGATPGRTLTYEYSYGDGTTWTVGGTGSFSDTDYNVQKVWDQVLVGPAARAHRVKFTGPAVAGWRIAEAVFYA